MIDTDLLSQRVALHSIHGYEAARGVLIGITTEPSYIVEDEDGKRHVYGESVIDRVEAFGTDAVRS